jgi:hypothetical protein
LVTSNTPAPTVTWNDPAANPAGKSATILVLLEETRVNATPSRTTTGEPDAGSKFVPTMVICLAVELMIALVITGVAPKAIEEANSDRTASTTASLDASKKSRVLCPGLPPGSHPAGVAVTFV